MASEDDATASPQSTTGVQVSCRLRGVVEAEAQLAADPLRVDASDPRRVAVTASPHAFRFDHVFAAGATQRELFVAIGEPCVRDVLLGYNCTVLAYGQTGSGKTYTTIGGDRADDGTGDDADGLVPRILAHLFASMGRAVDTENENEHDEVTLTASFIEVYQERLRDLLLPHASAASSSPSRLRIREEKTDGGNSSVWVDGATEIALLDLRTARAALRRGLAQRAVGATQLNRDSSRSHAVFAVTATRRGGARARLCVVDLAGSEQAKKTLASGARLDEAKHINRSLSALGNVIHALTSASSSCSSSTAAGEARRASYVPYRDSKLTRLLQSSLGGNAKTHLLLTCASAASHLDESLSTLRFGARATRMQNRPTRSTAAGATAKAGAALLATLQQKIDSLCRHIRELEDAQCRCRCGGRPDAEEAAATPAPREDRELEQEEDDSEVDAASLPDSEDASVEQVSRDALVQAELVALRRALREMQQRQRDGLVHAQSLERAVDEIARDERERLHERQARELERLDGQLNEADAQIAWLQQALRESHARLRHLEAAQRRDDDASGAEAEILRRRLGQAEHQARAHALELAASRREAAELRQAVARLERDGITRGEELETLQRRLHAREKLSPPVVEPPILAAARLSPPRSKPPQAMLRPVTVAGSNAMAIQSWWAGDATADDPREKAPTDVAGASLHISRSNRDGGVSVDVDRYDTTTKPSGRGQLHDQSVVAHDASTVAAEPPPPQQLHTSGGARPFRARLVGLLNSLEDEASSYKQLLTATTPENDSRATTAATVSRGGRPCAVRHHARRRRLLPELAAAVASPSDNHVGDGTG